MAKKQSEKGQRATTPAPVCMAARWSLHTGQWTTAHRCYSLAAHQHWHIDVSYLNIGGTFYYLCSILDGPRDRETTIPEDGPAPALISREQRRSVYSSFCPDRRPAGR